MHFMCISMHFIFIKHNVAGQLKNSARISLIFYPGTTKPRMTPLVCMNRNRPSSVESKLPHLSTPDESSSV